MKPAVQWFRVPVWADVLDANEQARRDAVAVVRLLRDWHLGADPNEYQFRTLNNFGAGRSIRLYFATLAWAKEAGAVYPERLVNVTGQKRDVRRTTRGQQTDNREQGSTPNVESERTTAGQSVDNDRTISRARALLEKREKEDGYEARAASPVTDEPREEAAARSGGAAGAPPVAVSPPAESHLPAAVQPAHAPNPEHTPLVVNGIELPRDLPALLSTIHPGFMHYIRMLLPAGVTTTEHLLRLTREEWRFMGHGLNPAKVNAIEAHLSATWGVSLGALAKVETKGAPSKKPTLFPPRADRAPSVDAIDHMFRKKGDPPKEVSRAE